MNSAKSRWRQCGTICQRDYATNNTGPRVEQWRCTAMMKDSCNNARTCLRTDYNAACNLLFTWVNKSKAHDVHGQQLILLVFQSVWNNVVPTIWGTVLKYKCIYNSCETWCVHKYVQLMYSAGPLGQVKSTRRRKLPQRKQYSWVNYNDWVGILQDGWMDRWMDGCMDGWMHACMYMSSCHQSVSDDRWLVLCQRRVAAWSVEIFFQGGTDHCCEPLMGEWDDHPSVTFEFHDSMTNGAARPRDVHPKKWPASIAGLVKSNSGCLHPWLCRFVKHDRTASNWVCFNQTFQPNHWNPSANMLLDIMISRSQLFSCFIQRLESAPKNGTKNLFAFGGSIFLGTSMMQNAMLWDPGSAAYSNWWDASAASEADGLCFPRAWHIRSGKTCSSTTGEGLSQHRIKIRSMFLGCFALRFVWRNSVCWPWRVQGPSIAFPQVEWNLTSDGFQAQVTC